MWRLSYDNGTPRVKSPDLNSTAATPIPRWTKEAPINPKINTISDETYKIVLQSEEIVAYIVTKLDEIGAPVTPWFGSMLHEFRNGTGPCVHPNARDKDFDLAVFPQHFPFIKYMAQ